VSDADIDEADPLSFERAWREWRTTRDRALTDPHGFLAVTALHWLSDEPTRFDDAPGTWSAKDEGVRVDLAQDEMLDINGTLVRGTYDFGVLQSGASLKSIVGDAVIEVAERGGRYVLRPRHPSHALVTNYHGTPTYPPELKWRVTGTFIPFASPAKATVDAAVRGMHHVVEAPGVVAFEVEGRSFQLTVFTEDGDWEILFRDATSGVTTYEATRNLAVAAPDPVGNVMLDFNRASNPPCAYSDFATCPLAPPENTLAIAIEAGEKLPYERRA
jgi:uncharacterized protein (DUF1684 family)